MYRTNSLLDQWQPLTQDNKPVAEIIKFDEFLIRCDENDTVVLSRFCLRLREDLRRELFVREISALDHVYQLVHDLNRSQGFPFARRTDYRDNTNNTTLSSISLISLSPSPVLDLVTLLKSMMIKG